MERNNKNKEISSAAQSEKYRIIRERLFRSDFDMFLETMEKDGGNDDE